MHKEYVSLEQELRAAVTGLTETEMQMSPVGKAEKWTVQQIVEHLVMTYQSTLPLIRERLEKRTPTRAKPMLRQRLGQILILNLRKFPAGRPAPMAVSPGSTVTLLSGDAMMKRVSAELVTLNELTEKGEKMFAGRRAVSHIVLGPLSLAQWRRFHLVHGRHHVKQVLGIRKGRGI